MKITRLVIGACLLSVLTGCHKPAQTIGSAEAFIKATALAAITAKHPDVSPADLKFSDLRLRALPDGKEEIFVSYKLPASAKSTIVGKTETDTMKTYGVGMSVSGAVQNVFESSLEETHNLAQ